jgi:cyclohexanone monooxygenase
VTLVSVRNDPIQEITPKGLRTGSQEYEFDVIIYATGFDAITGPLAQMNVRGVGGRTIAGEWQHGAKVFLGLAAPDFPTCSRFSDPRLHSPVTRR